MKAILLMQDYTSYVSELGSSKIIHIFHLI